MLYSVRLLLMAGFCGYTQQCFCCFVCIWEILSVSQQSGKGKGCLMRAYNWITWGWLALNDFLLLLLPPVYLSLGCGSVLNEKGEVEMDAIIMDGKNLDSGAVSAVKCIANPIKLARLVMEKVCWLSTWVWNIFFPLNLIQYIDTPQWWYLCSALKQQGREKWIRVFGNYGHDHEALTLRVFEKYL